MIEKLECTCIEAYTTRKMRDPNCCACSCDHNDLVDQLAKANESVKELELVIVAITHADETGYVDDVGFVEGWSDVCDETKSLLNKFAIEKKIEAISYMTSSASDYLFNHDKLDIRANHLDMLLKNFCNYHINQLRKEQDSE